MVDAFLMGCGDQHSTQAVLDCYPKTFDEHVHEEVPKSVDVQRAK